MTKPVKPRPYVVRAFCQLNDWDPEVSCLQFYKWFAGNHMAIAWALAELEARRDVVCIELHTANNYTEKSMPFWMMRNIKEL